MITQLERLVCWYFSDFPIERGKWRVWTAVRPFLKPHAREVQRDIKYGIRINLALTEHRGRFIYYWNSWEPNETWAIRQLLKPGDTFIDVGANIGYFTLLASRIVGKNGKVIAFEPVPETLLRLKENIKLNGIENVVVYEAAVSDRPGTVKIGKSKYVDFGMSTMRVTEESDQVWDVPALQLDETLRNESSIRFVKMDIEGAELLALKGFMQHLRAGSVQYVLCEITDSFLKDLGGSSEELFSLMSQLGYKAYSCLNERFTPASSNAIKSEFQSNILFSKGPL